MAILKWDQLGERYYETGVDHGVIYKYDKSSKSFNHGEVWTGLSAVNENPTGAEANPIYADNIKYLNLMSAEDFGASIECYATPNAFKECSGEAVLVPGLIIGQQTRKLFAVSYRTLLGNDAEGVDHGYVLTIIYNCLASPSEEAHTSINDSPEAASLSYDISTTPVNTKRYKPTAIVRINSTRVEKSKMDDLERILYGDEDNDARCPFPDEIIKIISLHPKITLFPGNNLYPDRRI